MRPTLVLGPSLGTRATTLWGPVIDRLGDTVDIVTWELPGHAPGDAAPLTDRPTMADLASYVLGRVDGPFHYAGDSAGGCVGLQLALDAPDRVRSVAVLCSGAKIADAAVWDDRIGLVRGGGTAAVVDGSRARWFGTGFEARDPDLSARLLAELAQVDDEGYVAVCSALSAFDVRDRLDEVKAPLVAVAGAEDVVTTPAGLEQLADGVPDGRLVVLPETRHLAPAERPDEVAALLRDLVGANP